MSKVLKTSRRQKAQLDTFLRGFAREEDGMVTILACFFIVMMVLVGGIGVDLMRNEMERVRIQNISDRAVLAAADLDQENDPEEVVRDYFAKSSPLAEVNNVYVEEGLNFRTVRVDANSRTPTRFMRFLGTDELPVPGESAAEERINKVEISLVLDISGSMADGNKMPELKQAAGVFIDTVLRDETEDQVSVTLIPYSEHVNAGPLLMDELNVDTQHNYSHCIEFDNSDFGSVRLNRGKWYDQMQHFQWNYDGSNNRRDDTVCPRYSYERIVPFSQDADHLKNQINQFQPRAGTSIFIGMKWAVGMLDPDFNAITTSLVGSGDVDGIFSARPESYQDSDTLKTVILMTDGQHDRSWRIEDRYYNSNSEVVHWNRYNLNWYLSRYVHWSYHDRFHYQKYDAATGDQLLYNLCNAAKEKKVVIWTIGFEVQPHGADVMRNCASSPSHFFEVEGVEITEAFEAIARQINQLRLIQ